MLLRLLEGLCRIAYRDRDKSISVDRVDKSHRYRKHQEGDEVSMVVLADAVSDERTVVIKTPNAHSARVAMLRSWNLSKARRTTATTQRTEVKRRECVHESSQVPHDQERVNVRPTLND